MEIMNGEIFVTVFSNINIWGHQVKLSEELSGTTYFEFQEAPKASENNLKLTEINRKLPHWVLLHMKIHLFFKNFMVCKFMGVLETIPVKNFCFSWVLPHTFTYISVISHHHIWDTAFQGFCFDDCSNTSNSWCIFEDNFQLFLK